MYIYLYVCNFGLFHPFYKFDHSYYNIHHSNLYEKNILLLTTFIITTQKTFVNPLNVRGISVKIVNIKSFNIWGTPCPTIVQTGTCDWWTRGWRRAETPPMGRRGAVLSGPGEGRECQTSGGMSAPALDHLPLWPDPAAAVTVSSLLLHLTQHLHSHITLQTAVFRVRTLNQLPLFSCSCLYVRT